MAEPFSCSDGTVFPEIAIDSVDHYSRRRSSLWWTPRERAFFKTFRRRCATTIFVLAVLLFLFRWFYGVKHTGWTWGDDLMEWGVRWRGVIIPAGIVLVFVLGWMDRRQRQQRLIQNR